MSDARANTCRKLTPPLCLLPLRPLAQRVHQVSYSKDGLFIAGAPTCVGETPEAHQSLAALFVFSKEILCEPPSSADPDRSTAEVYAAVYFAHRAWYRSVAEAELTMVEDKYEPFNSYISPARPQHHEDLQAQPLFAMKVRAA